MERVHEKTKVSEALSCVQVTLHVVARPEVGQIIVVDRLREVLLVVDVFPKLTDLG